MTAVMIFLCKVDLELPAIELVLVQVSNRTLCCLPVIVLDESKALLLARLPVTYYPVKDEEERH